MRRPTRRAIRVYPLPPQLPTNPYLDQLYGAMDAPNISVQRLRPRHALPALLFRRGSRILHLHFFDELTQRRSKAATVVRSLGFLALLTLLRARGVRLVWTAHNIEPHELPHPWWAWLVYRTVARWSDAVIAHSHAALDAFAGRYGPLHRAEVIPIGNYIGLYGPQRDQHTSRKQLGLPEHGPLTVALGALRPYKNSEGLLDAFAALPAETRGTLLVAGYAKDATYAAALRAQVAAIPGALLHERFVPDDELALYFGAADVVALPYQRVLTSAVLLCALSYGRPVVAPAFGPVCELVAESETGFLFAPGDQASLEAALARALAHPDLHALGERALLVAQRFDWGAIAARTAQVYREVGWGLRVKG